MQLFSLVFHCTGFGKAGADEDAAHTKARRCARVRANRTPVQLNQGI